MMRLAILILVLFCALFVETATAQQPLYRNFTDEDGLPSNTVYQIFQDPKGYLWVTTTKGVCRFDGTEFSKIALEGLQTEDMPIAAMDNLGRLWTANMAGELVCIDKLRYTVVKLPELTQKLTVKNVEVHNDQLQIKYYDPTLSITFTKNYEINNEFKSSSLDRVGYKSDGFYIGVLQGFRKTKSGIEVVVKEGDNMLTSTYANSYLTKRQVLLFPKVLASSDVNVSIKKAELGLIDFGLNFKVGLPFQVQRLYVFNNEELFLINSNDKKYQGVYVTKIENLPCFKPILLGIKVNKVFQDRSGQFWFATDDRGLICIPTVAHRSGLDILSSFSEPNIKALYLDYPKLYVGQNNGVVRAIDLTNGATSLLNLKNEEAIQSFTKMYKEKLSIITKEGHAYDLTRSSENLFDAVGGLKYFYNYKDRIYFAVSSFGVHFKYSYGLPPKLGDIYKPLLNIRSYAISERNDTVLLGTTKGLYGYAHDSVFQFKGFKQPELYITKLFVDSSKTIWICTDGKGLLAYNNEKDIQYFGLKEGLPSLNCSDIVQIDKRRFAVGTDKGLWIYDKVNGSYFLFDKLDGLKSNEITALASDGTNLWVGTTKGLVKCEIASLQPNPEIPFVEIVMAQYEQAGKFSPMVAQLNYLQNHVSFFLSSRALLAGKSRHYAYRLLGLDSNWVHTTEQKIEFLGLQPGKYRFEVKAFNEDGISSDGSTFYTFVIRPPWWKTTFFYISLSVLLLGLAFGLSYRYGQNIKKKLQAKYEIQTQINEFKQLALQSQMNPHFIFNSLNAIQSYLSTSDEINAMHYLSKFGRLIRMIFEQSKRKVIPIDQEVAGLQLYLDLEKLRFKNKVEYVLDVDPELYANDVMIPPLMVQPIVENSFRHGLFHRKDGGGLLEILFNLVDGRLQCIVRDNGVGRSAASKINTWKSDEHVSSAISNTSDRLKILDDGTGKVYMKINDLVDEQGEPCGTETILQF